MGGALAERFYGHATVHVMARGKTLAAIQRDGFMVNGKKLQLQAAETFTQLPPADVILITTKTMAHKEVAEAIAPHITPDTLIVPICNGVPWWFLFSGDQRDSLACLHAAEIDRLLPYNQLAGGVVYMAAKQTAPGVVENTEGPHMALGLPEPEHMPPHYSAFVALCQDIGFLPLDKLPIRQAIWHKLAWNVPFNPLSVIHGMTNGQMVEKGPVRDHALAIIMEMQAIADAMELGITLNIEKLVAISESAKDHKPSMLQDVEHGRSIERDAIVTATQEIAARYGVAIPAIDAMAEAL